MQASCICPRRSHCAISTRKSGSRISEFEVETKFLGPSAIGHIQDQARSALSTMHGHALGLFADQYRRCSHWMLGFGFRVKRISPGGWPGRVLLKTALNTPSIIFCVRVRRQMSHDSEY